MDNIARPTTGEQIELSTFGGKPGLEKRNDSTSTSLNQSNRDDAIMASMEQTTSGDDELIPNVQTLAPIDGGKQAWTFCFCAFILETIVWGFGFR